MFLCGSKFSIKTAPHMLTLAANSRQPLSFIFSIDDAHLLLFIHCNERECIFSFFLIQVIQYGPGILLLVQSSATMSSKYKH